MEEYIREIERIAARCTESQSDGYSHIMRICDAMREECVLSDEDIHTFNAYLEDNDMPTAFGNSDFVRIYKKIVGDLKCSDILKNWMEQNV